MKNTAARVIITILSLVTIAAILVGLYIHVLGKKFKFMGNIGGMGTTSDEVSFEDIPDEIFFDVDAAKIHVEEGDELSLNYSLPEAAKPDIEMKNGKLTVKSKISGPLTPFGMGKDFDIELTVPKGSSFKTLSIDQKAGDISVESLNMGKILIRADAGDIKLDEIKVNEVEIEVDAGNISISDLETGKAVVEADAGNLEISDSKISDIKAKIDAGNIEAHDSTIGSGSCKTDFGNVELNGNIGSVSVKSSVGNATINGR